MPEIKFLGTDDWIGMYVDGKLVKEDHNFDAIDLLQDVLALLKIDKAIDVTWESMEFFDFVGGHCPSTWQKYEEEAAALDKALEETDGYDVFA